MTPPWFNNFQSYFRAFLHLFYPHICLQCGTDLLEDNQVICNNCEAQLPYTHFFSMQNNPIEKIFWGRVSVENAGAALFFTKESIVQKIIYELKYNQNKKAGLLLGKLIAIELTNNPVYEKVDYLVPIPISKQKLKTRGFNQSQIICEAIIANGFSAVIFNGLVKRKNTATQTHKDRTERGAHYNTLFNLNHVNPLKDKHLLIIDDVITTGATLEAACTCLLTAKPKTIQIATAAYTLH